MVENFGKNWRMATERKKLAETHEDLEWNIGVSAHILAIRLNCSSRFLGTKVTIVYLEVIT